MTRLHCGNYLRVSTEEQNPENQRASMQRRCDSEGWEAIWYVDKASGKRSDREEFTRLVTDALSGKLQVIQVWALDRFGRDQVFMLQQIQALESAGLRIISATESWVEQEDDNRPILLGVTTGVAESELRRNSRRTKAGLERARASGKVLGRPVKPRSVVLEAARLVVSEGLSLGKAVARVNRGLPAKPEHPGGLCRISKATLHRYLKGQWKGSSGHSVPSEPSAPQAAREDDPEPGTAR